MKAFKKLKKRVGFTLAETLIAVLIILMVSSLLGAGIPAAVQAYQKVVDAANAQLLLSTTITRLNEELGTALWYKPDGGYLYYSNGNYISRIATSSTDTSGIMIQHMVKDETGALKVLKDKDNNDVPAHPLVTNEAATKNLHAEYDQLTYEETDGVFIVQGLKVKNWSRQTIAETITELQIRPVKEPSLLPEY